MTRKSKKQIENQAQDGRSMVEMLGVLAIIAILSIGGIVGFRLAMNYYQANQIAHEMNMMRTDAQIKIAQGADKLTLGSPYDDKKINFNDYGTDFGCIYMEDENAEPSPAFCTGANAYYIELKEIPEGVCRPLANLIDNMDNEIAFYINEKSVDAEAEGDKGACNEEFNTLRVIFGADSDSEAIKCGGVGDPECPENLPICLNHMCVECETNAQCVEKGKDPHCHKATHTCEPCPDGSHSEGNACVIHIQTIPAFKELLLEGYIKRCQKLTPNHFGPYTHSYELWIHGTFDDYIRFYVNEELPHISSTEPIYNEPDDKCNKINHKAEKICAGVGNSCSVYLPDYHLGTLNAGDFGHLTIYDVASWITWGEAGLKEDISRADAAAWLVLGDE